MNTMLFAALALADAGFHIFPAHPGTKTPWLASFPTEALRDPVRIKYWWAKHEFNPCISTTSFNGGAWHLIVVDVDIKDGKRGDLAILAMDLPVTYTQRSPTGGFHLVYKTKVLCRNSVQVLGPGVDTRGKGGFILGAGAIVPAGTYTGDLATPVADAPQWLEEAMRYEDRAVGYTDGPAEVERESVAARAKAYLLGLPAVAAGARNDSGFKAAAVLRDFGLAEVDCVDAMRKLWKASPPLPLEELRRVVHSAFSYGQNRAGARAPELEFDAVATPDPAPAIVDTSKNGALEALNEKFAYAVTGVNSNILHFTTDEDGRKLTKFLPIKTFQDMLSTVHLKREEGNRTVFTPIARAWMAWPRRRSYQGVVFRPGREVEDRFYNLWQGFAVTALPAGEAPSPVAAAALERWIEHGLRNVCGGNQAQAHWLVSYFAHMVQFPWKKPLVALVLRGDKGVGKDTFVDTPGRLFGVHYMTTTKKKHVLGDFNSRLENIVLCVLNEAIWAHDHAIQGVIQDLITGRTHDIERKGQEPYSVKNLLRLIVMGNADTLIPASWDERRYAAFQVTNRVVDRTPEALAENRRYFRDLRKGMESGGYELLLRFLQQYDISGVDLNEAPRTELLHQQKMECLTPLHQWWLECLQEGRMASSDFSDSWPEEIEKEALRSAFRRHLKDRQISGREPQQSWIGRALKLCCPSLVADQKKRTGTSAAPVYRFPGLSAARHEWSAFIGHAQDWGSDE